MNIAGILSGGFRRKIPSLIVLVKANKGSNRVESTNFGPPRILLNVDSV